MPGGSGREYYLDVDDGGLYRFDLIEAWITNLRREGKSESAGGAGGGSLS